MMKKLLLLVLSPVITLVLLEGILAVAGVAPAPCFFERREASADQPARLVPCAETPWGRNPHFQTPTLPGPRSSSTYRIFCLGASTVNGTPFARFCSFTDWLRVRLERLHPGRCFEVVRMAADARSASDIARLCEEVVHLAPDLMVVYTGHNEFLFANLPRVRHPRLLWWRERLATTRIGRLLSGLLEAPRRQVTGPIKNPRRVISDTPFLTDEELDQGYAFYAEGLSRIVTSCREQGVPLILCIPACNLRDYPPRRSHVAAGIDAPARQRLHALFEEGDRLLEGGHAAEAVERFEAAAGIDPTPALLHFRLARALMQLGRREAARREFVAARDRDNHPNRATSRHFEIIRRIAGKDTILAPCQEVFDQASEQGIAGEDLFVDNVHPDLDAQNLIAEAVLRAMAGADLVAPRDAWFRVAEPPAEIYRNLIGVDPREMATGFTESAVSNLVQVYGRKEAADPLYAAERLARFALRYDPRNATATFCVGLVAALRGRKGAAREYLSLSTQTDPTVLARFLDMVRADARLAPMATALREAMAEDPAPDAAPAGGGRDSR